MGRIASVGIHDDLAAGQATIPIRAADDEVAGRIDQEVARSLGHPAVRKGGGNGVRDHLLDHARGVFFAVTGLGVMLGRDDNLGASDRLAVHVFHRYLAFRIGLQIE